ncbi:MAG TPA: imidazole glycerol phosphate synthase subunit HisF [Candidatus Micrarchaeia archaeon]|nr:imidazole glycerol phosphate synthase subunit HisF [Candidatus Micrarchaeia archaeon]
MALAKRVVPCLDIDRGRVVKGVRFAGLRDAGDPVRLAQRYEAEGADELVILDVTATLEGRGATAAVVTQVAERVGIPVTVGGGVRRAEDVRTLLQAGADKVALNTAAVGDPAVIARCARRFGAQCMVVAIDARRRAGEAGWEVVVGAGRTPTGLGVVDWAVAAVAQGAGELLLTSIDRDGTQLGYDCALVAAVAGAVPVPVVASGGAGRLAHFAEALEAGADAVLAASQFHDRRLSIGAVKQFLVTRGIEVRWP